VHPAIRQEDLKEDGVGEFLLRHMEMNLKQAAKLIEGSEDDAEVLLHDIVTRLSQQVNGTGSFQSKQAVTTWEEGFARTVLRPAACQLNETLNAAAEQLQDDQLASAATLSVVDALLVGNGQGDVTQQGPDSILNHFVFWRPVKRADPSSLVARVGGEDQLRELCPSLARAILDRGFSVASALRYLPSIVRLQEWLIRRFSSKLDVTSLNKINVQQFLYSGQFLSKEEADEVRPLIEAFVNAFNEVEEKVFTSGHLGQKGACFCENEHLTGKAR